MNDDIRTTMVKLLPRLRRFSYSLTGDLEQADDLVQETCVKALSNLKQWQPGTRLDSWMYRIAQNLWRDKLRSRKSRGETVDIDSLSDLTETDGRSVVESALTLQQVSRDLSLLPMDQQILVGLICIDGLSYKEAASTLQIPVGTVMSRLARARESLARSLDLVPSSGSPHAETMTSRRRDD